MKNSGSALQFPAFTTGKCHDSVPDFIIRLVGESERSVILETKGYDPVKEVKADAARRWVNAVNASGQFGRWDYAVCRKPTEVVSILDSFKRRGH